MKIRHIIMAVLMMASPYLLAASDGFSGGGSGCSCAADNVSSAKSAGLGGTSNTVGDGAEGQVIDEGSKSTTVSIFKSMPDVQLLAWITSSTMLDSPVLEFLEFAFFKGTEEKVKTMEKTGSSLIESSKIDELKALIDSTSSILLGMELQVAIDMGNTKTGKGILIANLKDDESGSKILDALKSYRSSEVSAAATVEIEGVEMHKAVGFEICKPKPDDAVCEKPDILFGKLNNSFVIGHEKYVKAFFASVNSGKAGEIKSSLIDLANKWQANTASAFGMIADLSKTLTYEQTIANMDKVLAEDGIEPSMAFLAGGITNGASGAVFEFAAFLNSIDEADFDAKFSLKSKNFNLRKLLPLIFAEEDKDSSCEGSTNNNDTQLDKTPSCYMSHLILETSPSIENKYIRSVKFDGFALGVNDVSVSGLPAGLEYTISEDGIIGNGNTVIRIDFWSLSEESFDILFYIPVKDQLHMTRLTMNTANPPLLINNIEACLQQ